MLLVVTRATPSRSTVYGGGSTTSHDGKLPALLPSQLSGDPGDVERFGAVEAERVRVRPLFELQRKHAHANEVRAMDALETLRDHRAHAEELGALGGPIAGGAGAVLLAGDNYERRP